MSELIEVFNMTHVSISVRIRLLKKIGQLINYKYGANITDELVDELILILKDQDHK